MNLLQKLKPQVLEALNAYAIKYPTCGEALVEELTNNDFLINMRYGFVIDLKGLMPMYFAQTPYDLFIEL